MSIIAKELSEIRQTRKDLKNLYKKGELNKYQYFKHDLKYLSESMKRQNAAIQILVSQAKHGKKIASTADKINLLDSSAINTGDAEVEMIKCPETDRLITRGECLDSQGAQCNGCSRRKETQDKLLGPK
jgi:hypothetical protein